MDHAGLTIEKIIHAEGCTLNERRRNKCSKKLEDFESFRNYYCCAFYLFPPASLLKDKLSVR